MSTGTNDLYFLHRANLPYELIELKNIHECP